MASQFGAVARPGLEKKTISELRICAQIPHQRRNAKLDSISEISASIIWTCEFAFVHAEVGIVQLQICSREFIHCLVHERRRV